MRKLTRSTLAATAVAGLLAIPVAGATAETQVIDANLGNAVAISSAPADKDIGALPIAVDSPASIGQISVAANEAYTLSVESNYATMTGWDDSLATPAYDEDRALTSPMVLTAAVASSTGGGALATGVTVTTEPLPIASNLFTLLLSTTDTYDLSVTQAATAADPAGDYRLELTYTLTSVGTSL